MPLPLLALCVVLALSFYALIRWGGRPHTVVRFSEGKARLERGQLPTGLLGDLTDAAQTHPQGKGLLSIWGQYESLDLSFSDLEPELEQRIRNVVLLRRKHIRRP